MVFGNESPIAAVGRVVTVVAHHPIIVELEGVFVGLFAVDEDFVAFNSEGVLFVDFDTPLVYREVG